MLAILELDRGQTVTDVAASLRVTRQSAYNWVRSFAACPDPTHLQDHDGVSAHPWTEELQTLLLTS